MSFEIKALCPTLFQANWTIEFEDNANTVTQSFCLDISPKRFLLKCILRRDASAAKKHLCKIILCKEEEVPPNSVSTQGLVTHEKVAARTNSELSFPQQNSGILDEVMDCQWVPLSTAWIEFARASFVLSPSKSGFWESITINPGHALTSYVGGKTKISTNLWLKFEDVKRGKLKALDDFLGLFRQTRCDVQFQLSSGASLEAHLFILKARSPVFRAMFEHDTQESATKTIELVDVEACILKEFLYYLYSGTIRHRLTYGNAQSIYELAHKYDIVSLREECVEFLLANIRLKSAISLLIWSQVYEIQLLREAVVKTIYQNAKEVCSFPQWPTFVKDHSELCVEVVQKIVERL